MTLPKTITDAIDKYARAIAGACANFDDGTPNICRAALEAAIAAAIQPVEPPTDAEVEAWEKRTLDLLKSSGLRVQATIVDESGTPTEELDSPPLAYVLMMREAVALMRRARATGSWNGGPTVTALMRGVEDAAIEWGKCCGDYHAACQAAPPPSGLQATDAVREAGHRCELTYGYFQKAIKALADHGTQTGMERLRERVQNELDANRRNVMRGTATDAEEDCLRMVRDWIDEERGAGR